MSRWANLSTSKWTWLKSTAIAASCFQPLTRIWQRKQYATACHAHVVIMTVRVDDIPRSISQDIQPNDQRFHAGIRHSSDFFGQLPEIVGTIPRRLQIKYQHGIHDCTYKHHHVFNFGKNNSTHVFSTNQMSFQYNHFTLPETNMAPEIRLSQKETSLPTIHFQVLC